MKSITTKLQEDLLCLLVYYESSAKKIQKLVPLEYFDSPYAEIAKRAYAYIAKYDNIPGEVIATLMDDILDGDNKGRAGLYQTMLLALHESKDNIGEKYVMERIARFINSQELRRAIYDVADRIQDDDSEEAMAEAQNILDSRRRIATSLFDPGLFLSDSDSSLDFLNKREDTFPTGIPELDNMALGPARGELHVLIALYNRGKSWWLIHVGKECMKAGLNVCHLTLEMPELQVAQRYYQAAFAVAKRKDEFVRAILEREVSSALLKDIDVEILCPKTTFSDDNIRSQLRGRINKFQSMFDKLVIKGFPTGSLTVAQLEAYLENLEVTKNFAPDVLLLDYAGLMNIDPKNYRLELGQVIRNLRGLAGRRGIAVVSVHQANRESSKTGNPSGANVAEDFSLMGTCDNVLTYRQTKFEQRLNMARLYVDKARDSEARFSVLITQSYSTGQFCVDSTRFAEPHSMMVEDVSSALEIVQSEE